MVARSGLFVAPVPGSPPVGTSPSDGRRVLGALFGTAFNVLSGGAVAQSGSVMQFTVAQTVWAVPDPTDVTAVFASPSDSTVLTGTAGPGSGSRIDSIGVKQNDNGNGDADSRIQVALFAGVASGSPVAPTLPAGYVRYANIAVPTSAANAAACTVTILANSQIAPQAIKCTTQALLNGIAGLLYQVAFVTSDSSALNGEYIWTGAAWVGLGVWTTYTTTWTGTSTNPSVGNGAILSEFCWLGGKTYAIRISLVFGSTTSGGTGAWQFTLPPGLTGSAGTEHILPAKAYAAANLNWAGVAIVSPASAIITPYLPASSTVSNLLPMQNANASNAAGTGVPLASGAYSFVAGNNFTIEGIFHAA